MSRYLDPAALFVLFIVIVGLIWGMALSRQEVVRLRAENEGLRQSAEELRMEAEVATAKANLAIMEADRCSQRILEMERGIERQRVMSHESHPQ